MYKKREGEKLRRKKKILLVVLVLFLSLVGCVCYYFYSSPQRTVSGLPAEYGTKKMTDKDLKKYVDKKVNATQVTMEVYPEVVIKSDGVDANLWIHNVPVNKVGQQATLLDENNNVLAETGLIKPGYQVDTIKLTRKLTKGRHKGTIKMVFYDLVKKEKIGQEAIEAQINVE